MRQGRTHAFAAPEVDVVTWRHERAACRGLPCWYPTLLQVLIERSNFKTGAGRTGYGELINALTPDQPERGPRLWAPSRQDIKTAIRRLESLRVLAVDRLHSEQVQSINFQVAPRVAQRVPKPKQNRECHPGSTEVEQPKQHPGIPPGLSAVNRNTSPTPYDPKLSTAADPSEAVRMKLAEVTRQVRAGGRTRAPKGA